MRWLLTVALLVGCYRAGHGNYIETRCHDCNPRVLVIKLKRDVAARCELLWAERGEIDALRVWRSTDGVTRGAAVFRCEGHGNLALGGR